MQLPIHQQYKGVGPIFQAAIAPKGRGIVIKAGVVSASSSSPAFRSVIYQFIRGDSGKRQERRKCA